MGPINASALAREARTGEEEQLYRVPKRRRRQDGRNLRSALQRMRRSVLVICSIDVYGQPICKTVLQFVR
jgi:hypothetical protein